MLRNVLIWGLGLLWALPGWAFQLASVSPQGEVARVSQVVLSFDAPVTGFGDASASAPAELRCSDSAAAQGSGRWLNERRWAYDFATDLPPGVVCSIVVKPGIKSSSGAVLTGASSYQFNTGGPFVQRTWPSTHSPIDEAQYFILQLNGAASLASVQDNLWCAVQGVGERVAIRLIDGAERSALLKSQGLEKAAVANPLRYVTLACQRQFAAASQVQLVYGKGVSTPPSQALAQGVANQVETRFRFKVREPFAASLSCERENAQAACLPIRPLRLSFNAPVARKLLQAIALQGPQQSYPPHLEAGDGDEQALLTQVSFNAPLPEKASLRLTLPPGFVDASARSLRNAEQFPLTVQTAELPPLAKFAAAPFGIIERLAEPDGVALMPLSLRRVEAHLAAHLLTPTAVNDLRLQSDADIIAWWRRVQRFDEPWVPRKLAAKWQKTALPKPLPDEDKTEVQSRAVSLLQGQSGVQTLALPRTEATDPRPFELIGVPLAPGFHVLEIRSERLGRALLDERLGPQRSMLVRSSALVTNLGVHFKLGRESSLAWVTSLDQGLPVAGARVQVSDCQGRLLLSADTDARGMARLSGLSPSAPTCQDELGYAQAYFVSARARQGAVDDLAFTWSDWQRGIEPWRFDLPTSLDAQSDERAHSILDRSLLRRGETLSMKHILRRETSLGFGLVPQTPHTLVITHVGSGQQYTQALQWRRTASGGQSAESTWAVPPAAKLGSYELQLRGDEGAPSHSSGSFRVEEFRLPVLQGRIAPNSKQALVQPRSLPLGVQVNYVAGGPAAALPVRVSALLQTRRPDFSAHEGFSFAAPRSDQAASDEASEEDDASLQDSRLIANKLPLTLDKNGSGQVLLDKLPELQQPHTLQLEASYFDPNGEMQTLRSSHALWPAALVAGIKTEGWASSGRQVRFQALALDLSGKPLAGVALQVQASARITTSSRKRLVGGFYSYDNQTRRKELGSVCSGSSDAQGLLHCEVTLQESGEIELVASAKDSDGRRSQAAASIYITRQGELWFGGQDHDRMDLLPEKKAYQPGETARFQVRMPFRAATALLTVEREGILHTEVLQLSGQDPLVQLRIQDSWGPNVYVSVLALRGRLRDVPWYSFFTWGYKTPRTWWNSFWLEGRDYVAPSALVDLSKPSYRLGATEIRVGTQAHQLDVQVRADREAYPVRAQAQVSVQVKLPTGQPAAHAEVALAAVDQALLELMPNTSWDLLQAMLQRRSWGVETSTAQMEIVGRRHYGRKAVPAGGGGGRGGTRELLDTLLLWQPRVQLDAQGRALVSVPLNDALTTFKIVAVADAGTGLFGTGSTQIRATQDLQIITGLPPLVREDDHFRAQFTLRNTTERAMKVQVHARATLLQLAAQTVDLPPGQAREVAWTVQAPAALANNRLEALLWEIEAQDTLSKARDALKASQRIVAAVPLTVQQGTLLQIDGALKLPLTAPAGALTDSTGQLRGGLKLALQPRLAEGLPGVRDWLAAYPYACLEQKTSVALGLRDLTRWQRVAAQIPSYLDADGLANYFPPREDQTHQGSDTLTAYLIAASHEAASQDTGFALSEELRAPMLRGLSAFVEGRLQRKGWSPRADLDVRKLAAIDALARWGQAQPRMLSTLTLAPNQWPTHAVLDWISILQRLPDLAERDKRLAEAWQIVRGRLSFQGSKLTFASERDDAWWWLMQSSDVNAARLLLLALDDPAWRDDLGRLANGFMARQQNGAWPTTTANLWGSLALQKFSARLESAAVTGSTQAAIGLNSAPGGSPDASKIDSTPRTSSVLWSQIERSKTRDTSGAMHQTTALGAPSAASVLRNNQMLLPWAGPASAGGQTLSVTHQGSGKPWLSLQALAAVPLTAPVSAGYQIRRSISAVEQANAQLPAGSYTRGDVLRVTLEVSASSDMSWVVVTDPVPGGASILGSGLGRDSLIATQGERANGAAWPAFEERSQEAYRSYYEFLPKGVTRMQYTVRLNNVGDFALPASRVEAMYAPEMFGAAPNARVRIVAAP